MESGARRQILNAAAYLLRHRGYEAATTRAIAAEVGIKGAFGRFFKPFLSIFERVPSPPKLLGYDGETPGTQM